MSCFCRNSLGALELALPSLNISASLNVPSAKIALSLSSWMGARGLPALPWAPDLAWLELELPRLSLSATAMATISAFAQLQMDVMAQFGIDLTIHAQATAFARLVATANARLSAMVGMGLGVNLGPWQALASLNFAIGQLEAALSMGLFANLSMYGAWPDFRAFLLALRALLPLIAATLQMKLNLSATASLSASIRAMLAIKMPVMASANLALMAQLTASLSAVASLSASLGLPVLKLGFAGVEAMLSARLALLLPQLSAALNLNLELPNLLALLPALPYCPTLAITPAVVSAAMSLDATAVAAMNWQVPAISALPLLSLGLPVCALTASLSAALNINAALNAPCPICDAAAVLSAAMSL